MKEIYSLTTLRFFAASLVFVEHLRLIPGFERVEVHYLPGRAGVAVFFVLSGFILSYTYGSRNWTGSFGQNAREFYWSRFARIYPLHWLMFLVALPVAMNSRSIRPTPTDFPWLLTLTDMLWPGVKLGWQPVFVSWTLSCEALFYLLSPFIFLLLSKRRNPLLASVALFAVYTSLIVAVVSCFPTLNWMAYLRVPEFLLGIVAFHLSQRVNFSRFAALLFVGGILALFTPILSTRLYESLFWSLGFAPGAAMLIIGAASARGGLNRFLSRPRLVLLGQASYALYLLHDPLLRYSRVILVKLGIVIPPFATIPFALFLFGVLVAGAVLCFRFYENPVRLKLRAMLAYKSSGLRLPKETPQSQTPN
jgi:peptidoglycan/LPS O-acetylase OafA/YrhL